MRAHFASLLILAAFLLIAPAAHAGAPVLDDPAPLAAPLTDAISARITREVHDQQIVGISIALVKDGRIIHTWHVGWEDREKEIPATDATMYRWASISKPLTAIVAMQLWEQDRLDLDADVRLLTPEFPVPRHADQQHIITTRQLLSHQGGIVHYTNGPVINTPRPDLNGRYFDIIDALDTFKSSPLVNAPGENYSYTTHGYILLGALVQRAGDQPYPEQVRQRIILPLGMTTLQPDYQWEEIPNRTIGYRRRGTGDTQQIIPSTNTDVSWKLAGGGWISNVNDLALLATGMLNHQLVKPHTRTLMWTRQATASGEVTGYGLGFQIGALDGRPMVSHGGSQEKTRTLLAMLPDSRTAVAIMCNTEDTNLTPLARDLLRLMTQPQPAEGR